MGPATESASRNQTDTAAKGAKPANAVAFAEASIALTNRIERPTTQSATRKAKRPSRTSAQEGLRRPIELSGWRSQKYTMLKIEAAITKSYTMFKVPQADSGGTPRAPIRTLYSQR